MEIFSPFFKLYPDCKILMAFFLLKKKALNNHEAIIICIFIFFFLFAKSSAWTKKKSEIGLHYCVFLHHDPDKNEADKLDPNALIERVQIRLY